MKKLKFSRGGIVLPRKKRASLKKKHVNPSKTIDAGYGVMQRPKIRKRKKR